MSIIAFNIYKEKFERLLADTTITEEDFNSFIEELISQVPLGAMQ